jgi:hypothetical protein
MVDSERVLAAPPRAAVPADCRLLAGAPDAGLPEPRTEI